MLIEFLRLAGQSILHRRLRSWLTVIGVFIGIAAVVGLITLGLGFEQTIKDQVSQVFGVDTFMILEEGAFGPGGGQGNGMGEFGLDLGFLKDLEGVKVAAAIRERTGFIQGPVDAEGSQPQGFFPVLGLSPELITEFTSFVGDLTVEEGGRLFEPGEQTVTVLGSDIADRLGAVVGDTILIAGGDGVELTMSVVGILLDDASSSSGPQGGFGGGPSPDEIYVPYETMSVLWPEETDTLFALVRTEEGADVDVVADRVEDALNARGSEVTAVTYSDISEQIGTVTQIVSAVLAGIAGISLVVGAVGVMNTMFTSVLERTKEIGVMKAVGAKNGHVLSIFLIESGLMGLVGGLVGAAAGIGLAVVATALINGSGFLMGGSEMVLVISPGLLVFTLFGSFALGALAGFFPALRASRLPVVDALRYE